MDTYDIYSEDSGHYIRNLLSREEALTKASKLAAASGGRYQTFRTPAGTSARHIIAHHIGSRVVHLHN